MMIENMKSIDKRRIKDELKPKTVIASFIFVAEELQPMFDLL